MEAENTLTVNQKLSNEIFFKEETRRLREAFVGAHDEDELRYLRNLLQDMSTMMRGIEMPWERFAPVLFRSFAIYMRHPEENLGVKKVYRLMVMLMDGVTCLSQNKSLIHKSALFFEKQVADIDELLEERDKADVKIDEN